MSKFNYNITGQSVQEIECSGCGKCEPLTFTDPIELVYKNDVVRELGWTIQYGYYYCPSCSSKGTVR